MRSLGLRPDQGRSVAAKQLQQDHPVGARGGALEVPGLHFHALRHTGNTLAADMAVSLRNLMAHMGHDNERATLTYQHASNKADRNALSRSKPRLGIMSLTWAFFVGAGDGNRTRTTSLGSWSSAIELHPRQWVPLGTPLAHATGRHAVYGPVCADVHARGPSTCSFSVCCSPIGISRLRSSPAI